MKELTHYTFSIGSLAYLVSLLGLFSWSSFLAIIWLSFSVNYLLDILGHTRGRIPSRTRLTHSVFTAPLWGAAISSVSFLVLSSLMIPGARVPALDLWLTAGILIAVIHLLLDGMTQAGVYYWRRRIAIAHFRYDNVAVNASFVLLGLGLVAIAVTTSDLASQISPIALSLFENLEIRA